MGTDIARPRPVIRVMATNTCRIQSGRSSGIRAHQCSQCLKHRVSSQQLLILIVISIHALADLQRSQCVPSRFLCASYLIILETRRQRRLRLQAHPAMAAQVNFALAPGLANNLVTDHTTSEGVKLCGKAVSPLDPQHDLKSEGLCAFL
jgi:hypothetical protein